jgi:serine protease Do
MSGELVGINSMIYTRSGGSMGLGFAIPSNVVETVIESAVAGHKVVRPWMGGTFQVVTSDIADAIGLARPQGVLINKLDPLSPLAKAGLLPGDVILAMDGRTLESPQDLQYQLGLAHVGDKKLMEFRRDAETKQAFVTLIAAPETTSRQDTEVTGQNPLAGATVANLSPAVADELGIDGTSQGVVITNVKPGPAQQFFAKGDILRQVNGVTIDSVATLVKVLGQNTRGWTLALERGGQRLFFRLG